MTAPPPVPGLPDDDRRTAYSISAQTGPFGVGFALYGDRTDYGQWVEVWLNGVQLDPLTWVLSSPSGSIATLPRPITDAVVTLNNAGTGTLQVVGACRPRRLFQFAENRGVPARDFNQALTGMVAQIREFWDRMRDRMFAVPAGETISQLPPAAARINKVLGFGSFGELFLVPMVGSVDLKANLVGGNTFSGNQGIGKSPTVLLDVEAPNSTKQYQEAEIPHFCNFVVGQPANPIISGEPAIGMSQYSSTGVNTSGGQNATLYVQHTGAGSNAASHELGQINALTAKATQNGYGDCVGIYGVALQNNPHNDGCAAYGGYFVAVSSASDQGSIAVGTAVINNSGAALPYLNGGGGFALSCVLDAVAQGNYNCGAVINVRGVVTSKFDSVLGIDGGSLVKCIIDNYSDCTTIINSWSTTHTHGIDLSNATFGGFPFRSPGYSVGAFGDISGKSVQVSTVAVASLPAASTNQGRRMMVSNATATTFWSIVAAGGANIVPVTSDGTNWRIG